jgi:hypothetical protein
MSHGHSGRDSCFRSNLNLLLNSEADEEARGVTDVDVGSGALLGLSSDRI